MGEDGRETVGEAGAAMVVERLNAPPGMRSEVEARAAIRVGTVGRFGGAIVKIGSCDFDLCGESVGTMGAGFSESSCTSWRIRDGMVRIGVSGNVANAAFCFGTISITESNSIHCTGPCFSTSSDGSSESS